MIVDVVLLLFVQLVLLASSAYFCCKGEDPELVTPAKTKTKKASARSPLLEKPSEKSTKEKTRSTKEETRSKEELKPVVKVRELADESQMSKSIFLKPKRHPEQQQAEATTEESNDVADPFDSSQLSLPSNNSTRTAENSQSQTT